MNGPTGGVPRLGGAAASRMPTVAAVLIRAVLIPGATLSLAAPGVAQDTAGSPDTLPAPDSAVVLEEVRVTVSRADRSLADLPLAVTVVRRDADAPEARHASVADELRGVPGVFVQDRRNYSLGDRLLVRGTGARAQFGVRGVQVLVDGVPLTLPDGQVTLSNVPLASVARTEVVRGPAAALYGNAAGGVIRFHTRTPEASPGAVVGLQAGSHGYLKGRLGLSGRLGGTGYVMDLTRMETEGYREHSRAEIVRGNLVTRTGLGDRTDLRGVLNLYHTPFAQNPSSLGAEAARTRPTSARSLVMEQGLGEEATQVQGGLTLRHGWEEEGEIAVTAWGLTRDLWNPIPFRIIDVARLAGGVRSRVSGRSRIGGLPVGWGAGLDLALQHDDRIESANAGVPESGSRTREGERLLAQTEEVASAGPFVQTMVEPAERWRLTLAARWDAYRFSADDRFLDDGDDSGERTMEHLSPFAGVTYRPADDVSLYANYSSAFETPTTSELSNRPDGAGGFNPALGPAVSRSVEVGGRAELADGRVALDVAAYHAEVDDALVPFEGETEETFFRNAGEVDRRGVEAGVRARPVPPLELRLVYDLRDHRFESFPTSGAGDPAGNREPAVPPHRILAGADYTAPFGLRAGAEVRWVDAFPVNDANTAWTDSYRVVDLRLSASPEVGGWTLRPVLEVENLTDERYSASVVPNAFGGRYYEPAPGRSVFGGLSVSF